MSPTLLAAIIPAAVDLIKGAGGAVSRKFFGLNVDEQVKLETLAIERMKAVAELDQVYGNPSLWVVDLRASFRYIAAGALILIGSGIAGYAVLEIADETAKAAVIAFGLDMAGTPFGFIFGERMWNGLKSVKK